MDRPIPLPTHASEMEFSSPSPSPTFTSSDADDVPTVADTSYKANTRSARIRARLRPVQRWLPALAGFALSVYSLVQGVMRLRENAHCEHPLGPYLVVTATLGLTQLVLLIVRVRLVPDATSLVFRALLAASLLFFIAMFAFTIVGATWVWSINTDKCDAALYESAQKVVIVQIVISVLVFTFIGFRVARKVLAPPVRAKPYDPLKGMAV